MPKNWKTYKIKNVTSRIYSGGTPSTRKKEFWNGEISWLSSGETRDRYVSSTDKTITKLGLEKSSARMSKKGSIVIASAGQGKTRGQTSFLNIDTTINQSVICVEPDKNLIDDKFLFFNLSNRYNEFRRISDAFSIRGSLTIDLIKTQIKIDLPPLPEQKAIANILSAIDDKIENNLSINKTLEDMAMALYKHWFVDFGPFQDGEFIDSELGPIPKGWEVKRLDEVCNKIYSGGTPKTKEPSYWNGKIPWLSSGETRNKFVVETDKFITELGLKKSSSKMAYIGNTVIASAGQGKTRGQTSYLFLDTSINQSVIVLEAKEEIIHGETLFLDLSSRYDEFRMISDSYSTRGSLTTKLLSSQIKLALPAIKMQTDFKNYISKCFNIIESNINENQSLTKLRDTLLPKLISGEVRLKEFREQVEQII